MSNEIPINHINKLCTNIKTIHDSIHGFIQLSYFAVKVIDTPHFQRLRSIKQLGTCSYVFPNAVHTRFEHSIGTYHVASEQLNSMVTTTDLETIDEYLSKIPELHEYYKRTYNNNVHILDEYVCELIKIAALCHDIGHGPFSHVFDDYFIQSTNKKDVFGASHEERSGLLIEKIIKGNAELSSLVTNDEIQFMKNLINPESHHTGFIYQIVSNSITGLDVDKFDYLLRDSYLINFQSKIDISRLVKHIRIINNDVVYPEQAVDDIYNLLHTRYRLHKQVYCHKVVISTQFLIVDILLLLDDILHISDSVLNMDEFIKITDDYIFNSISIMENFKYMFPLSVQCKIEKARELYDKLVNRQLYGIICTISSKQKIQDVHKPFEHLVDVDNIVIYQGKIGFVSGNKPNPFDNIYVYKTKDTTKIVNVSKESHTHIKLEAHKKNKNEITMLTDNYQECFTIFYYKDKTNIERIKELNTLVKQEFIQS
jgi:HD superfamily phosphohydrolase